MNRFASSFASLILLLLSSGVVGIAQPTEQYSHGNPNDDEQYMLELINRARANPAQEGVLVIDTPDQDVQQAHTYWQIDKEATKQAFTTYPSRPPLVFHPSLVTAAQKHTADMIANNFQGHVSSDGLQLDERFAREGYVSQGMFGENVAAYSNSVWYGYVSLIVDWGQQNQIDLGHRRNILNFDTDNYTEIGLGIAYSGGGLQQGTVGPYVITQDFATRSVRYIVGVCFADQNKNGMYDQGEGLEGVRITPSRGQYYAITSVSGGYAIPFTGSGNVTVTASGGSLSNSIVKNATFEGDNLKVDFSPSAQVPGIVVLMSPSNNSTKILRTSVVLEWQPSQFANQYEIQIATLSSFSQQSIVYSDTIADTSAMTSVPSCGTKYYWRVRALNDAGAGAWSSVFSFITDGKTPTYPTLVGPKGAASVDFDKNLTFTWNVVNDAQTYQIRLSTQSNMNSPFFEDSLISENSYSIPASIIPSGTNFYWTVRSVNDCGASIWSAVAQVVATVTSIDEVATSNPHLSIRPNPITSTSVMTIQADLIGTVRITMASISGETILQYDTVFDINNSNIIPGTVNSLAPGVYFISISQQGRTYSTLVVKE